MVKFRFHRGGLKEAMETVIEVGNKEELKQAIIQHYKDNNIEEFTPDVENITIEPYGYDNRIDWDTYIVSIPNYGVLGFTNGPLE